MDRSERLKKIVEPLLAWFDVNARILPWRDNPTPYRVWVSEIMLQQTRVEAVKPYYRRFLEALPDVRALAECDEEKLLKLWEGLGYYNRVRNMQEAARTIVAEYGGELPADYDRLLALKGIGSYTAGAIASIACGIPVPAVDGNVLRVVSRVTASEEDITKASVKSGMEQEIRAILPEKRAGAFNQALMELGAIVCVPNGMAKCSECPLAGLCLAYERDLAAELPKKARPKPRRVEERTVLLIRDGERVALHRRSARGLLAGMYELPNEEGHLGEEEVLALLKDRHFSPLRIRRLTEEKHIFSHVEWRMVGYLIQIEEPDGSEQGDYLFVEPSRTEDEYPVPAAFARYMRFLQIRLGQEKYEEEGKEE